MMKKRRSFVRFMLTILTTMMIFNTAFTGELVPLYPTNVKNPKLDNTIQKPPFNPWTDDFLNHTDNVAEYYLGSGALDDTFFVVFDPEAACLVMYAEVQFYTAGNYISFAALYSESASIVFPLGQAPERGTTDISPIGTVINGFIPGVTSATQEWETIDFGDPFIAGNPVTLEPQLFGIGFIKQAPFPNPLADDVSAQSIYYTYTWFGGPWTMPPAYPHIWGAYSSDFTGTVIEDMMRVWVEYIIEPQDVTVTLTPENPPIIIPANGGSFDFNIEVTNNEPTNVTFDIWSMVTLPNGTVYGPLMEALDFTTPPNFTGNRDQTQDVPSGAPSGNYTYDAYIGIYPNGIWAEDHFDFSKSETDDGGKFIYDWADTGESFEETAASVEIHHSSFINHHSITPNPFNPSTTITFDLQDAEFVSLRIFDTGAGSCDAD